MNYFKDCECQETAKEKYRSLAKKLHPDMGGTDREMMELTRQYEEFKKYGPSNDPKENVYQQAFRDTQNAYQQKTGRYSQFYGQPGGSNHNPHIQNALNQAQYWKNMYEDMRRKHERYRNLNPPASTDLNLLKENKILKMQLEDAKVYLEELDILKEKLKQKKKKATKLRKKLKELKSNLKT